MLHILSAAITLAQYAVTVVQYISVSISLVFVYVGWREVFIVANS